MCEKTIYRKARKIGYSVSKGKVHFLNGRNSIVCSDEIGYNVIDNELNCLVWGCYNSLFDHQWNLSDVVDFLKKEYESLGLKF